MISIALFNVLHCKCSDNTAEQFPIENDEISPKWTGLTKSLLVDIYGVHRALKFGQLQRTDYPYSEFLVDVANSERKVFRESICTPFVTNEAAKFALSFYPLYLVKDDLFEVMACHFAVSLVVNQMMKKMKCTKVLTIRSVVVPASIRSRYDLDDEYDPTISDVNAYIQAASSSNVLTTAHVNSSLHHVSEIADKIIEFISILHSPSTTCTNIAILFNRQKRNGKAQRTLTVFEYSDWSDLSELDTNYFVSFEFLIDNVSECTCPIVRCWLNFGVQQRLRFYPEYSVWIIQQLFVRSTTMTTYKMVQTLYSEEYKHGWRVSLDDKVFNKYYHIITGYEHVSNNYNRKEVLGYSKLSVDEECGLRDHLQRTLHLKDGVILSDFTRGQAYDSETILEDMFGINKRIEGQDSNIADLMNEHGANLRILKFAILRFQNMECTQQSVHHVEDCEHIESVIQSLLEFQKHDLQIDALSVVDFDLDSIINGFDHIIKVHQFLSDDAKKVEIQNYIAQRIQCSRGKHCDVLMKHSSRARERQTLEEKQDVPQHEVDALCDAISDVLHSVHCYVLHRNDHLYRLLSGKNNKFRTRFATEAAHTDDDVNDDQKGDEQEERVPLGINFGLNVLRWLPYKVYPVHETLKDEIIRNPESTVDRALFNHYEMLCIAKIKRTSYTLKEMLCLKLYSDTTDLQAKLRRAHWTVASLAIRKTYYQWGRGLYETHLYHAAPIPIEKGKNRPSKLYHGLSQMFMMTH